ncbi:hypothetical protein [Thalassobacillus sp. CUG 92003]|uniref:hypothetical protein n=1 Tax=Thalassobacillus sp. CUG 92003 TaxID=2736641 RepID=UPI0015E671C8|nr:hypothetical protein [Thalassobacillus sp. CUG 92003]
MKYRIYRFFNTIAHLTFKKRRTADNYVALIHGGYISKRAMMFLLSYKAKEDE